ncbi:MAG: hypothetical protein WCD79_16470 [Chthoniobacteraceae bacterium]
MKPTFALAAVFTLLFASPAVHAGSGSLNPDASDSCLKSDGTLIDPASYQSRVGEYFAPGGAAYVIPFLLPTLPAGEGFTTANLRMQLLSITNEGNLAKADLYGIGVRAAATVLPADYYQGQSDKALTVTLIQAGFLTPQSAPRTDGDTGPFVTTNAEGDKALAQYLNKAYDHGKNAGKYVFLRVSYTADPIPDGNNAYALLTEDATGDNEKPVLKYTTGAVFP